ncbi:MAG TPA: acetamidase/formamidase family protein [Hyphomicrobiaceae bacterium]|nr:acetamidase/formamidase family protein [Hyphomicrobiaceae bacterium]
MSRHHHIRATAESNHWGAFDAAVPSILTVESGDRVTIETINGAPDRLPKSGFAILPEYAEIHAHVRPRLPGHICTGPVAIRGAKPGHVLEVGIEAVELRQDWGFNIVRPLAGALPDDFDNTVLTHLPLDVKRGVARLPWGDEVPLKPFFGVMGVAPPPGWGAVSTVEPRRNGGNMDNKELVAGTTLYLPVHADGALFSCGDGHGAQGDGEVCITAIETALTGTFRFTLRPDMRLDWPMAETPTHAITMAFDPDLDRAARIALREMIKLIVARKGISREHAYMLCSLAADLRVTQCVNRNNGIHVMLERRYLEPRA